MPWIKSCSELANHHKTYKLAELLSVPIPYVIGTLQLLWWFTLEQSWENGDLKMFTSSAIASACKWEKDPEILISSLQKSGFLDDMRIHDWLDFAGRLVGDRIRYKKSNKVRTGSVRKALRKTDGLRSQDKSRVDKSRVDKSINTLPATKKTVAISPHVKFVEDFKKSYEVMTRQSFKLDKVQFILAQKLIKSHGIEAVVQKAKILGHMCRNQSSWFTKDGWASFSITKLSSMWNSIIPESAKTDDDKKSDSFEKERQKQEEHNARVRDFLSGK